MSDSDESPLENFSGRVRVFPLPNLVMFPHLLQPLHVFEQRYRELTEEALATDQLIAMAVLAPGWEPNYEGRPKLLPTACLGRITTHHRLDGGRFNLLLAGLSRVSLESEIDSDKLFREFDASLIEDVYPPSDDPGLIDLRRRLIASFRRVMPKVPEALEQVDQLLSSDVPLGTLTDIIAYTLNLPQIGKENLLQDPLVDRRAESLIKILSGATGKMVSPKPHSPTFPPGFSDN